MKFQWFLKLGILGKLKQTNNDVVLFNMKATILGRALSHIQININCFVNKSCPQKVL